MQNPDDILTVLVLYNSTLRDAPAYRSLSKALRACNVKGQLFVYDNSPERQVIEQTELWNIQYVHDPANPGVSKAYNKANAYALAQGLHWLLLADQDTYFPADIFDQYRQAYVAEPHCGVFAPILIDDAGIVSPFVQRFARGRRMKSVPTGRISLTKACAINSGLVVSVGLFGAAGGYDERVRLDFSDVNFFRKLRPFISYFVVLNTVCRHTLSSSTDMKLTDALRRFMIYLEGSRITGRAYGNAILFECNAIARALRLSWRYRSLLFFSTLFTRAT